MPSLSQVATARAYLSDGDGDSDSDAAGVPGTKAQGTAGANVVTNNGAGRKMGRYAALLHPPLPPPGEAATAAAAATAGTAGTAATAAAPGPASR